MGGFWKCEFVSGYWQALLEGKKSDPYQTAMFFFFEFEEILGPDREDPINRDNAGDADSSLVAVVG